MTMRDHGHRGIQSTSYRTRDIEVAKGVNVVRIPEPVYDEESVVVPCEDCFEAGGMSVIEDQTQDALDGAALRRLREAPGLWHVEQFQDGWLVRYWTARLSWTDHYGATIAEAADACREALPVREPEQSVSG